VPASTNPAPTRGRGLAISDDPDIATILRDGLKHAVENVTTALAVDMLPQIGAADIVALHAHDAVDQDVIDQLPGTAYVILLVDNAKVDDYADLLTIEDRVVAVLDAADTTSAAIAAIARRVTSGAVFGLADRTPSGTEIHTLHIQSFTQKLACLERIKKFAKDSKVRGKYREAILGCADELLMNALYVAPNEAAAASPAQELDKETIAARAQLPVVVQYAVAEHKFYLSVSDTYGTIDRDTLLRRWRHAIGAQREGGESALGLFIITNTSTTVSFNELPGVATECVCSFDLKAAKIELEEFGFYREIDADAIAALETAVLAPPPAPEASVEAPVEGPSPAVKLALVIAIAIVIAAIVFLIGTR
jgi:hypothetical protein